MLGDGSISLLTPLKVIFFPATRTWDVREKKEKKRRGEKRGKKKENTSARRYTEDVLPRKNSTNECPVIDGLNINILSFADGWTSNVSVSSIRFPISCDFLFLIPNMIRLLVRERWLANRAEMKSAWKHCSYALSLISAWFRFPLFFSFFLSSPYLAWLVGHCCEFAFCVLLFGYLKLCLLCWFNAFALLGK